MKVLVTGGAGYIGSHTSVLLLENGIDVVIVDDFSNSDPSVIKHIETIVGKKVSFYKVNILNEQELKRVFEENEFDACVHFAAKKAVGESVKRPIEYYENNFMGTISLIKFLMKFNCRKLIISSSATVYGDSEIQPLTEELPRGACTNPYGWTKVFTEQLCEDLIRANENWKICLLRYFNPLGAHSSGLIGDNPKGVPTNLMPYITQVASGKLNELKIFGRDYPTTDGTCIRDFVHVMDLASGHLAALNHLDKLENLSVFNLGTGLGYSVLEVVNTFMDVNGIPVSYSFAPRRPGDVAISYADVSKAKKVLGWRAVYTLKEMCRDSWRWELSNS